MKQFYSKPINLVIKELVKSNTKTVNHFFIIDLFFLTIYKINFNLFIEKKCPIVIPISKIWELSNRGSNIMPKNIL